MSAKRKNGKKYQVIRQMWQKLHHTDMLPLNNGLTTTSHTLLSNPQQCGLSFLFCFQWQTMLRFVLAEYQKSIFPQYTLIVIGHQYVNGKQASYKDEILGDSSASTCSYLDKQQWIPNRRGYRLRGRGRRIGKDVFSPCVQCSIVQQWWLM